MSKYGNSKTKAKVKVKVKMLCKSNSKTQSKDKNKLNINLKFIKLKEEATTISIVNIIKTMRYQMNFKSRSCKLIIEGKMAINNGTKIIEQLGIKLK